MGDWDFFELLQRGPSSELCWLLGRMISRSVAGRYSVDQYSNMVQCIAWYFCITAGVALDCNSLVWNILELDFKFYIEISM